MKNDQKGTTTTHPTDLPVMNLSPDLLKAQLVNGNMCARKILNRKKSLLSLLSNFSMSSVGKRKNSTKSIHKYEYNHRQYTFK